MRKNGIQNYLRLRDKVSSPLVNETAFVTNKHDFMGPGMNKNIY
jgi:hypothetical protein